MHQPLPARVEDLKRKACQSDKQVTLTTTKGYKRKWRQWRCYCRPPLPNSFLMHLLATTSSQTASEFLHWFITFSQPPLVFSLHLYPSLSLTPLFIFFSLQGMIGFPAPLILSWWSVAGRWRSWWLPLLRHHLQHWTTEIQKNAAHKNLTQILVYIKPSSLAYLSSICTISISKTPSRRPHCSQVIWYSLVLWLDWKFIPSFQRKITYQIVRQSFC